MDEYLANSCAINQAAFLFGTMNCALKHLIMLKIPHHILAQLSCSTAVLIHLAPCEQKLHLADAGTQYQRESDEPPPPLQQIQVSNDDAT